MHDHFSNRQRNSCLFTPSTTSGEKGYEEFVEEGEQPCVDQPYVEIECITPKAPPPYRELSAELNALAAQLSDPAWLKTTPKAELVERLKALVPSFAHVETGHNLDEKI